MSSPGYDVVIVGGGIVGAAIAAEFTREKMTVAIVEAGVISGGATAAGMGHIVVMDDSEAQFALTRYSQRIWRELAPELPTDCEYMECGTIWVAADEEEIAEARRKQSYYAERVVAVEVLDANQLSKAEPNLRRGLAGGLLVPQDAVVYPPCVVRMLVERAQSNGATLFLGKRTEKIDDLGVTLTDGSRISSGLTVNATGAWATKLMPQLAIQPRKGHLLITDRYPGFIRHQLVELGYLKCAHTLTAESVAFNVQPRMTGQLLIGSSRQLGSDDPRIEQQMLSHMLQRAVEYIPGLGELSSIRSWTGFRAATPDKLPLIGPCPGYEHVFLATGHEGLGITTSLGTAKLIVDQALGRKPEIPVEPYLPSRAMKAHE